MKLDPILEYSTSNFTAMLFYTEVGDSLRNASHTPLKCHLIFLRMVSKPLSRKITELKNSNQLKMPFDISTQHLLLQFN